MVTGCQQKRNGNMHAVPEQRVISTTETPKAIVQELDGISITAAEKLIRLPGRNRTYGVFMICSRMYGNFVTMQQFQAFREEYTLIKV